MFALSKTAGLEIIKLNNLKMYYLLLRMRTNYDKIKRVKRFSKIASSMCTLSHTRPISLKTEKNIYTHFVDDR